MMAESLGLTPLSRAKLAALVSSTEATNQGLDALAEKGRAIREKRNAVTAPEADSDHVVDATETVL